MGLSIGQFTTWHLSPVSVSKRKTKRGGSRQKPQPFCDLISKVTSCSFFHSLLIRSKWLGPAHTQGGGYCSRAFHQEVWITGGPLWVSWLWGAQQKPHASPITWRSPSHIVSRSIWLTSLCSWNWKEMTASLPLRVHYFVTIQFRTWECWWQWWRAHSVPSPQTLKVS